MADLTLESLLESGAHFGHQTSRWNPKMKKYILSERKGIHLINLKETLLCLNQANKMLADIVSVGKKVLFVGTKSQAKDAIQSSAEKCKQFYVNSRWLGGMLTNFATIKKSIKKVEEIDTFEKDGTFGFLPKKEVSNLKKRREKILSFLGGIRDMRSVPGAIVVVDMLKEHIAVKEATKIGIPIIGIIDTNSDPNKITCPVPANDDSLKTISLLLDNIADVIASTPVQIIKETSRADWSDGRKRIVKRKVIKKIIKKKVLKERPAPSATENVEKKETVKVPEKEKVAETTDKKVATEKVAE